MYEYETKARPAATDLYDMGDQSVVGDDARQAATDLYDMGDEAVSSNNSFRLLFR